MAELVISALLPLLLEKLASAALKRIARDKGVKAEINKWEKSLKRIKDVLANASRHEDPDDPVKQWLNDLQHLAYDIDDLLDGWETEARQREFTDDSEAITVKVRKLITPTCCTNFSWTTTMLAELDHISTKLQDLVMERDNLGLIVENVTRPRNVNRRLQGSMVHAPSIIGREKKKKALVKELLAADSEPCNQNFSIVPIVGLGGVGKTTLARLLYNEKKVNDHFQLKAWVCVSDEFNSFGISKVIFQSVAGIHKKFADLNLLQIELSNHLREKKFLLVLDDVWSENYEDWETLVRPFHACAPGSRIIMTTRKEQLLRKLGYNNLDQLECLQHEDALSLVAQHALGVNNFHSHLSLEPYGRGIVEKCGGLPLALIALGRLLRTKKNEEEYWKEVLDSEIWTLEDGGGVLALRLSYNDLSPHLKHLFAYCSLFPKGFRFDKDELVVLWMAEGFLNKSTSNKQIELLGHDYFDELLLRSFFQHAPDNKSLFVMHDLINDLATSIAGEFFVRFDNETENRIQEQALEKYRHMSFVREEYVTYKKFDTFKRFKSSRTFLALEKSCQRSFLPNNILVDLLPKLPLLRVLSLSDFHISEVPESIGTLRHLRYLNLSRTQIEHLPESVCNLYNLETLIFFGCSRLTEFPKSFYKLKNLRHLDIRDTQRLHHMPLGIGEMKSLQTLTKIIIEGESGFEITEVKELKNLCGKISIVGLDKVQNAIHARQANFSKKMITELEVEWSQRRDGSRNEMLEKEVMDELKPCDKYLKKLKIGSYGGLEFPIWVGDPSFHQLKLVSIRGCKKCTSLPPLGQLPSLKELFIEGLEGVTVVGMELLGTGLPFPSLEILCFKDMPGWGKWSTDSGVVFPRLRHLRIRNCPNLVEVSLEALPSLNHLEIIECDSSVLRKVVKVASSVNILMLKLITGLDDVVLRGITGYLGKVEELIIQECNEIRYLWESEALAERGGQLLGQFPNISYKVGCM
ncbi:putative P-loop containing nucleoside triphosphate hydrolase, leucine-rich repeat domain superfamily [Helianthus annuus]|nr:putative P-loop containing nucleoside triphosphate hydrolase, leucine-rich repeat domain superfamily [Helianthus annuus]KAJ0851096.1 putative P-loop containing nucleoside triphosphate hydrolase, leucine-rich repeat domain superfamily [Helianthus annuus]